VKSKLIVDQHNKTIEVSYTITSSGCSGSRRITYCLFSRRRSICTVVPFEPMHNNQEPTTASSTETSTKTPSAPTETAAATATRNNRRCATSTTK
jgi:hypothetical protein